MPELEVKDKPATRAGHPLAAAPPKTPAEEGMRVTLVAVVVNGVLAVGQATVGLFGNSYALLADGLESLGDIFGSLIVWSGLRIAARPPDDDHPYGHGKAEPLAALIVAVGLGISCLAIGVQSIRRLLDPGTAPAAYTLIALAVAILGKGGLGVLLSRAADRIGSSAIKADAHHHYSHMLTSAAAMVGVGLAVVGGPRFITADAWAALLVAAVIGYNSVRVGRPALAEVMDAAPEPEIEAAVRQSASQVGGVERLTGCAVRKMGFDYYVDLHVAVEGSISVREGHSIAEAVEARICSDFPRVREVLVHVDPA
jgi:cation diffusion facilitator family transporter